MKFAKNNLLVCQDLIKIYHNPVTKAPIPALRGCDFDLKVKEVVGIVGPSGAGKTTLLRLLAGLDQATSGQIRLGQLDYSKLSFFQLSVLRQKIIGLVEQFVYQNLFSTLSVLDNILLFARQAGLSKKNAKKDAFKLLKEWNLLYLQNRKVGKISGGEGLRVSLLAALIKHPRLLLADEPTGQLDRENARLVQETLRSAVQDFDASVVVVTHDKSFEKVVDRTFLIESGRLSSVSEKSPLSLESPPISSQILLEEEDKEITSQIKEKALEKRAEQQFRAYIDQSFHVKLPAPIIDHLKVTKEVLFHLNSNGTVSLSNPRPVDEQQPDIAESKAYYDALDQLVATMPSESEEWYSYDGLSIVCENIDKSYTTGTHQQIIFNDFDCEIRHGETVILTGVSGVGKTTLLGMLLGLFKPDSGQIGVLGTPLTNLSVNELREFRKERIGIVRQNKTLFPGLSPYEILNLIISIQGKDVTRYESWIQTLLAACRIAHRAHSPIETLSGGELQRAALATALVKAPPLIVLDEPTANLDSELAKDLIETVLAIQQQLRPTLLLATHDRSLIQPSMREIQLEKE